LGVGIAGEQEYADIELSEHLSTDTVSQVLSAALPEGLRVLETRLLHKPIDSLMGLVDRAVYRAVAQVAGSFTQEELNRDIDLFLAQREILIERRSKKGEVKEYNLRPGIFALLGIIYGERVALELELKAGSSGNVRCEEALDAFEKIMALPISGRFVISRVGLFQAPGEKDKDKNPLWQ
jgi:radical SAM-linked protein